MAFCTHSRQSLDTGVISQRSTVKNLAVTFDSALYFNKRIKEITYISFYHLLNIAQIRYLLSTADAEILILAFLLQCLIVESSM